MSDFQRNVLREIRVELLEEFDRNFERKGFFNKSWPQERVTRSRGTLLNVTGALRNSLQGSIKGNSIEFTSSLPYAAIHNEGGKIVVTRKMKSYFWYRYQLAAGAISGTAKERDRKLNQEAMKWKSLALMPEGKTLEIPQRQFVGWHPKVHQSIKSIIDEKVELDEFFKQKMKAWRK